VSEFERGLRLGIVTRLLGRWRVPLPPTRTTFEVDWVSGASFMVRTETIRQIGLFDEGFFLYFEEVDLCARARRQGWAVFCVGESSVSHIGAVLTGIEAPKRSMPRYWFASRCRYFEKNHGHLYRLASDVAFISGHALWRARRRLQRKEDHDPPGLLSDFIRFSLSPDR
jgi:N-acetylglucosaminyl-diphospho-decaprenol L-rhamnosyltransferase